MVEFIMRVNIFEVCGVLQLSEIESFDANYKMRASKKRRNGAEWVGNWTNAQSDSFMQGFWFKKIIELFKQEELSRKRKNNKRNFAY